MTAHYAFFDVDGTLLQLKSMFSFHDFWYRRWRGLDDAAMAEEHGDVSAILRALTDSGASREHINRRYYEFFAGRPMAEVEAAAQAWARGIVTNPEHFVSEVVGELQLLRSRGVEPVFVSGSFVELLGPVAEYLGVRHVLATRLMQAGGRCTGRIEAPQTIGAGKAVAVQDFLARQGARAADCWAFGDDHSDLPMLELVGRPVAVVGDPVLGAEARQRGWRSIDLKQDEAQSLVQAHLGALVEAAA